MDCENSFYGLIAMVMWDPDKTKEVIASHYYSKLSEEELKEINELGQKLYNDLIKKDSE